MNKEECSELCDNMSISGLKQYNHAYKSPRASQSKNRFEPLSEKSKGNTFIFNIREPIS